MGRRMGVPQSEFTLQAPARLDGRVEVVEGINGATLLFDSRDGRYLRLNQATAQVLESVSTMPFQVTMEEALDNLLSAAPPDRRKLLGPKLIELFRELHSYGVTRNSSPLPELTERPTFFRIPLIRDPQRHLEPLVKVAKRCPSTVNHATFFGGAFLSCVLILLALRQFSTNLTFSSHFVLPLLALLPGVILHEAAHVVLLGRLGVRSREAGIGFVFRVLPLVYVDTTDSYRLANPRSRVAVSLIGPWVDLALAATYLSIGTGLTSGGVSEFFTLLGLFQLALLLFNLNPFIASDGVQALEAATGTVGHRARAYTYVLNVIMGRDQPSYLQAQGSKQRLGYIVVVSSTLGWIVFAAVWVGYAVWS